MKKIITKSFISFMAGSILLLMSCSPEVKLQYTVDQFVEESGYPGGAVLGMYFQDGSPSLVAASGYAYAQEEIPMEVDTPFHTASVSKTFMAAVFGIFADRNYLDFDDPISRYLSPETMENLHVLDGVDYAGQITIRHLLQHTSGLADVFIDENAQGYSLIEDGLREDRNFTFQGLLDYHKAELPPRTIPGEVHHYSDTNYLLLRMILENLTGNNTHEVIETLILQPLNMDNSFVFGHPRNEAQRNTPVSDLYFGDLNVINNRNMQSIGNMDGGIVSTAGDLHKFAQALFVDNLVKEETLNELTNFSFPEEYGSAYGLGMRNFYLPDLDPELRELTVNVMGGTGAVGSFMYYCPELGIFFTGTCNQGELQEDHFRLLLSGLYAAYLSEL